MNHRVSFMLTPEFSHAYRQLTEQAGFVDVSTRSKIEFRGDDRTTFLHNFCTNEIKQLAVSNTCEAFVCDVKGHVLGHLHIAAEESSLWIETVPNQAARLLQHWDRYLIREKVEMIDRTAEFGEYLLIGPEVANRLAEVRDSLPGVLRPVSMFHVSTLRLTFPVEKSEQVRGILLAANIPECPQEASELLRIESCYPHYGIDITAENLPQEVDRNAPAISFTKGCYLGQETVARIDALGHVNKVLRLLQFDTSEIPAPGSEMMIEGKLVAKITSGGWSPRYSAPLALAYVRRGHEAAGTRLPGAVVLPIVRATQ